MIDYIKAFFSVAFYVCTFVAIVVILFFLHSFRWGYCG